MIEELAQAALDHTGNPQPLITEISIPARTLLSADREFMSALKSGPSEFRDPKVHQRILSLSEGVLVRICRLIETAATEAIHSGQEHISLALLKDDLVTGSLVSIADRRNRRVSAR